MAKQRNPPNSEIRQIAKSAKQRVLRFKAQSSQVCIKRKMTKRAIVAEGSRKAAKTHAGRERCDRCQKAVFENQVTRGVNGRVRHLDCWPAYKRLQEQTMASAIASRYSDLSALLRTFDMETEALREREACLKAVNCVSKGVRDALMRTCGGQEVSVALALANGM